MNCLPSLIQTSLGKNIVFIEVFSEFACGGPKLGIFVNVYVIKLLCGLVIKKNEETVNVDFECP